MSIIDYFKIVFTKLVREKKRLVYSLVIFICSIISIGILIFNDNFENLINHNLSNVIGFRTINVNIRPVSEDITKEEQGEKDLKDLKNINHVVSAYDANYNEVVIFESSFLSENLDGTMTLIRGTANTLPTIVAGRGFEDSEKGVAICPTSFYPTYNPRLINRKYLLNGNSLLETTFSVNYYDYISNMQTGELKKNQMHTKNFKIIGLYDVSDRFNDNGTCYISIEDLIEIVDTENSWTKQYEKTSVSFTYKWVSLNVVVDSIENLDFVIEEINNLGFEILGYSSSLDSKLINGIKSIIILTVFLTLLTIILIVRSYIKKMLNSEEKNIAILRAGGYSKKIVHNIYVLQIIINNLIIYIVGVVISLITFFVLKSNVPLFAGLDLMVGGIKLSIVPFLFTFFAVIIIPSSLISYNILKKSNLKIVSMFESAE